jgi:XRE family aerobic/anaerobic benzoate catabolism transcriptional regulator
MLVMSRLLTLIGERVRDFRHAGRLTQQQLADKSGVSLRFLAQVEAGAANISVERLDALARALRCSLVELVAPAPVAEARTVALLGMRGAGKSTVGAQLAKKLGWEFVELDAQIERTAGFSLAQIFELYGDAYYHQLEQQLLKQLLADGHPRVLATGGGLVGRADTYRLLRRDATTVWLKARPQDHWNRVRAQGDKRPMAENPHAMAQLRAIYRAREPAYRQADIVIDTSKLTPHEITERLEKSIARAA